LASGDVWAQLPACRNQTFSFGGRCILAKKRLKVTFLNSLTYDIAKDLSNSVKPEHLLCGHRVKTIDSSGNLMADTGGGSKTWQK
jgi:hypothetical protein